MELINKIIELEPEFLELQGIDIADRQHLAQYYSDYILLKENFKENINYLKVIMKVDFKERKSLLMDSRKHSKVMLTKLIKILKDIVSDTDSPLAKYLRLETPLKRAKALFESEYSGRVAPNGPRNLEFYFMAERMKRMKKPKSNNTYSCNDILNFFSLLSYEYNFDGYANIVDIGKKCFSDIKERYRVALNDVGFRYEDPPLDSNYKDRMFTPVD